MIFYYIVINEVQISSNADCIGGRDVKNVYFQNQFNSFGRLATINEKIIITQRLV